MKIVLAFLLSQTLLANKPQDPEFSHPTVDKSAVKTVIKNNLPEIQKCYSEQLKKSKSVRGKIIVYWLVDNVGQAKDVQIRHSTLDNKKVENCIAQKIESLKFPAPPAAVESYTVSYPFVFDNAWPDPKGK